MLHMRRPAALLVPTLLLASAALTACGDDGSGGEETAEGFDAVSISGPVGETPEIEWQADLEPGDTESEVLEEGDGAEIADGDQVLVNFAISDDFTEEIGFDTFGEEHSGLAVEVGAEAAQPQQALDLLTGLVREQVEAGMTLGTRIGVVLDAKEEWGDTALALAEFGIGNEDGLALVVDLESVPLDGPDGKAQAVPSWAPEIVEGKSGPTALDSSGVPKPDVEGKQVRVATVVRGTGPKVEAGDLAVVEYLGQTWGGEEPFDSSFEPKRDPLQVNVGDGVTGGGTGVIKGWSEGLEGVPVGSRVIIEIPPKLGYGEQGQGEDIKGDDILYFVVDVLGAA